MRRLQPYSSADRSLKLPLLLLGLAGLWLGLDLSANRRPVAPAHALAAYDPWLRFRCEINSADSAALVRLPGLGPALAQRLVETRTRLGGFLSREEVLAVPGVRRQWATCSAYIDLDPHQGQVLRQARRHALYEATGPRPDLNQTDSTTLVNCSGLPGALARRLLRFRDASGGFRDWAHVARTWNLSANQLIDLQAAFDLKPPPPLDLNTADLAALDRLPGIGERRARAILNYRQALGFFVQVEQLREVYNLPDSIYERIYPLVQVRQPLPPPPLAVNRASADELARHPYLRRIARRLVRYRHDAGLFRQVDDLVAAGLIDSSERARLAPYLSFER